MVRRDLSKTCSEKVYWGIQRNCVSFVISDTIWSKVHSEVAPLRGGVDIPLKLNSPQGEVML